MNDGSDLAIISGSGKLPLLIKKSFEKATYITITKSKKITGRTISEKKSAVKCQSGPGFSDEI